MFKIKVLTIELSYVITSGDAQKGQEGKQMDR